MLSRLVASRSFSYFICATSRLGKTGEVLRIYAQMQREKARIPMTFACNVVLAAFVSLGTADG